MARLYPVILESGHETADIDRVRIHLLDQAVRHQLLQRRRVDACSLRHLGGGHPPSTAPAQASHRDGRLVSRLGILWLVQARPDDVE